MYPVFTVPDGDTLPVLFHTFDSNDPSASVTITGLAVTDIEIYKDGSTTQRASDSGYSLLDTDGTDFDGVTGIHGFSIDLSDNTDAGFYTVGSWFHVVVSAITVDAATINFIACAFRIVPAEASAGVPDVNVASMDANTVTSSAIASDAITAAKLAADASAEIADAVLDEALSGHTTAGTLGKAVADIETDATAILADTNELQTDDVPGLIAALNDPTAAAIADAVLDEALSGHVTAGTLGKAVADIETDATAILADTGTDGVVLAADQAVDVTKISGSATAADNLEASALGIVTGQAQTGTLTTTTMTTNLTEATDDHYNGRIVVFTSGVLAGQATDITDYNGTTKLVTMTALTEAPGNGDAFVIV